MQALGPFNNLTNNCISFLRLLACNGVAAALAPAVCEEREFVPRGKCIALGQLVPLNPRAHHLGSRNTPALLSAGTGVSSFKYEKKVSTCFPVLPPLLFSPVVVLPSNRHLNEMCTHIKQVN